jgi:hypothetical protein
MTCFRAIKKKEYLDAKKREIEEAEREAVEQNRIRLAMYEYIKIVIQYTNIM